jgi:hypothetical protein
MAYADGAHHSGIIDTRFGPVALTHLLDDIVNERFGRKVKVIIQVKVGVTLR